jgi:hypothetical protein
MNQKPNQGSCSKNTSAKATPRLPINKRISVRVAGSFGPRKTNAAEVSKPDPAKATRAAKKFPANIRNKPKNMSKAASAASAAQMIMLLLLSVLALLNEENMACKTTPLNATAPATMVSALILWICSFLLGGSIGENFFNRKENNP